MPLTSELVCLAYKQSSLKMGLPASAHALLNGTTPDPCPNGVARAPQGQVSIKKQCRLNLYRI
eukprot:scaffold64941_cov18-Tisochrysis_lutea.AAC.1